MRMLKYVVIVVVLNCAVIMLRTYSTITTQLYIHVDIQFLIPNYIQFYSALHPSCLSYFCGTSSQDHSGLQIIQQENASQVCTSSALLSVTSVDKGVISSLRIHYKFCRVQCVPKDVPRRQAPNNYGFHQGYNLPDGFQMCGDYCC